MRGLLADANSEGSLRAILRVCRSPGWRDIWLELRVPAFAFKDFSLDPEIKDDVLWQFCQDEGLILFTDNRNEIGATSLGRAIREKGTAQSLPVLTTADSRRVLTDRAYTAKAAERMIDILMDIDLYRGTGRLYLPEQA